MQSKDANVSTTAATIAGQASKLVRWGLKWGPPRCPLPLAPLQNAAR